VYINCLRNGGVTVLVSLCCTWTLDTYIYVLSCIVYEHWPDTRE